MRNKILCPSSTKKKQETGPGNIYTFPKELNIVEKDDAGSQFQPLRRPREDVRFKGAGLQSEFKCNPESLRETLSQGVEVKRGLWV